MPEENVEEIPQFTKEFRSSINDFAKDLTVTFPEYKEHLEKWCNPETLDSEFQFLFEYCLKTYPERFFDILNQNISLFSEENEANVEFLPGINFKVLFHCEGVTDKTRETIWKYLQVILLILVNSLQSKINFGEAMNVFDKIDVSELQGQLEDAMKNISSFFDDLGKDEESGQSEEGGETKQERETNLPNVDGLREHLQFLFDGKIGRLAKELADSMTSDLSETFGSDFENINSTQDVLSALMKNPEKMGKVVSTVKDKLADKMKTGDITKEDLVSEASEMMNKMQNLGDEFGGMGNMGDMFKTMAQSMGMNIPKGARVNTNAMEQKQKQSTMKERLKARALEKKKIEIAKKLEEEIENRRRQEEYNKFMAENPNFLNDTIFSLEEKQEKSQVRDPNVLTASQKKRQKKKARKQKAKEVSTSEPSK